ncbi:RING-H2 finger protein ATL57 [Lactuca sativa]|uniref:RING-H2 finger protein ATL57 n=1 Tax=Lactuca sativa TaxID=4236 RepID=UPI000CBC539D|nr:RING-H2 finger protein ATL57 [Lactuca sativa]
MERQSEHRDEHHRLHSSPINTNLLSYRRSLLQDEETSRAIGSPTPSFTTNSPFDSSLALTILVLLTVLFFMAFFSLYIRRFTSSEDSLSGHQRRSAPHSRREKHGGVDATTVRSLPVVPYGGDSKIWGECSICLSEFEERETVKVIPYCRHGFHPVCIDRWLSSHVSCPLCRSTELFPAVDEV